MTCTGNTGHGSRFIEKTAAEKLQKIINLFLEFREQEKARLNSQCSCLKLGDVTTINLTNISVIFFKKFEFFFLILKQCFEFKKRVAWQET